MLHTYKAILIGDRLEWDDEAPEPTPRERPVPVHVTILDDALLPAQRQARGQQMTAALERLAATTTLASISDPVAWQREARNDRRLPERDA